MPQKREAPRKPAAPYPPSTIRRVPLPLANSLAQPRVHPHTRTQPRLFEAPAPLRLWHLASLDAPTVAVAWSSAFAFAAGVQLPRWIPLLLFLGTWSVYIGDRLLDFRSAQRTGNLQRLRDRHYFHWRHRKLLLAVAICTASAATALIFIRMPLALRERNSVLAIAALAYFTGVHSAGRLPSLFPIWSRRFPSKEFLVGILFTAGCAAPVLSRLHSAGGTAARWPLLVATAFFAALAWLNCRSIESFESPIPSPILPHAIALALAGLILAAGFTLIQPRAAALLLAGSASALLLAFLDRARHRLTPMTLRIAADLALLTVVLPLILSAPLSSRLP
jgi:hypothetical protein